MPNKATSTGTGTGKGTGTRTRTRDWGRYDSAKIRRKQLFIAVLLSALDLADLPTHYKGRGRPPVSLRTIIICLAYKTYYKTSYRDTIAEIEHQKDRLGIPSVPCYNTLRKYMNSKITATAVSALLRATILPLCSLEKVFGSDSTGFRTNTRSEYYTVSIRTRGRRVVEERQGQGQGQGQGGKGKRSLLEKRERREFVKLHLAVGTVSQMVCAATTTIGRRHDSTQLPGLVVEVARIFSVHEWLGDAAYASRKACNLIAGLGGRAYIWPRTSLTRKSKGSSEWRRMLELFELDREEFSRHYHQRSKVESVFSVIKRYFGDYVLSRSLDAQLNELLFKVLDYNLCRLGYLVVTSTLATDSLAQPALAASG